MASAFFNAIIIMLCVNIVLFVAGVRVIDDGSNTNFISQFIDTDVNESLKTSTSFNDQVPNSFIKTGNSGLSFAFIDPIAVAVKGIIFFINIVLTPIGLFGDSGFPVVLQWMLLPITIIGYLGLIFFLRGVGN